MISYISLKNFVLIDWLELDLSKGFNVFTGETGAGKSLLIEAIDLAFGKKITKNYLKNLADKAVIELVVSLGGDCILKDILDTHGIDLVEDHELTISREITSSGGKLRVNGSLVNTTCVKDLRGALIEICNQHASQVLLSPRNQLEMLDRFGELEALREEYTGLLLQWKKLNNDICALLESVQGAEKHLDFLDFQIQEIDHTCLTTLDEDEKLLQELKVLENTDEIKQVTSSVYRTMVDSDYGSSPLDAILQVKSNLFQVAGYDQELEDLANSLESTVIDFEETLKSIRNFSEKVDNDPEKIDHLHERLNELNRLKKKYGPTLQDVLLNYEKYKKERDTWAHKSYHLDSFMQDLDLLSEKLYAKVINLSKQRSLAAVKLAQAVELELQELCLQNPVFRINLVTKEIPVPASHNNVNQYHLSDLGIDTVDMTFSANPGHDPDSISKIASGGELSRIMLAIKSVLLEKSYVGTVIFDEIDAGTSGQAAQAIAEKMSTIARYSQILYITHQPIIAAMADQHYHISKVSDADSSVFVKLQCLTRDERKKVLAGLASGMPDDIDAINFGEKLLVQAEKYKQPTVY